MIGGRRVIAIVPARAGSKSIRDKNLARVGGVSLVGRAVRIGLTTSEIDRVIVSTDSARIAAEARVHGAEVYERPESLAGDEVVARDVLVALRQVLRDEGETAEIAVLLEPTAPFRTAQDVSLCIRMLAEDGLDSVATFTQSAVHPHRVWRIRDGRPTTFIDGAIPWLPRQALPPAYQLNGLVYCFRLDGLLEEGSGLLFGETGAVIVEADRSVDIDTPLELDLANLIHARLPVQD